MVRSSISRSFYNIYAAGLGRPGGLACLVMPGICLVHGLEVLWQPTGVEPWALSAVAEDV